MRRTAAGLALALAVAVLPAVAAVAGPAQAAGASCGPLTTTPHFTGSVPSPQQVLGFPLGSREATDQEIGKYWNAVGRSSDKVVTGTFAHSWQDRPLRYALVGSPQTLSRLPQIRSDLAALRNPATPQDQAKAIIARTPTVLWITANVHGNEPSGGDAVLRLLYELTDRDDCVSRQILGNSLVGLIPTQNPDGRANNLRTNGYTFDMNRDWFARTQPETAKKLDLLWQYPPHLYVDEHEMGGSSYFFPPDADPIYHETSDIAYNQIANLYGGANAAAFDAEGWSYQTTGAGYDLFYQGYGDSVPTTEFGAAGMTYEQGGNTPYPRKVLHHYTSAIVSLYTGATHRAQILFQWRRTFQQAQTEGAQCALEPNKTYTPGNPVLRPVPDIRVCGYFLPGSDARTRLVVRRLQLAHVQVQRLTRPLYVPDYTAYGRRSAPRTVPAGTFWVTMDQAQKHWVQAMLNEDTYVPFPYFYDISGWSNPLLAGIPGGYTGRHLSASLAPVPLLAQPAAPRLPHLPRVAIIDQRPDPTYRYQTTGWLEWRLAQDWQVPYTVLTPEQVTPAAMRKIDVLLVPDVDAQPTFQRLGGTGRKALRQWVRGGGRYVGWQGGTVLASALNLSSVGLADPTAVSPGALMRITAPATPNNYVLWDDSDLQMSAGAARVVAAFPDDMFVSGYSQRAGTLSGSAVEAVDAAGAGSVTVFSVEPNFRGYTDGSAQLLFAAMLGTPSGSVAAPTSAAPTATRHGESALTLAGSPAQHLARDTAGKS